MVNPAAANAHRGEYGIKLDKMRILKYGFLARTRFQEVYGKPLQAVFMVLSKPKDDISDEEYAAHVAKNFGERDLAMILWAGLLYDNRTLKPEDVVEFMEESVGEDETYSQAFVRIATDCVNAYGLGRRGTKDIPVPPPVSGIS